MIPVIAKQKPNYFDRIKGESAELWDFFESKPAAVAATWHLFRQIQSPRHVLSELLQNADDAGARSAGAQIINGTFIFEHDGADFTEAQFESLCNFGLSNKRTLHTIGFRGIGFKSIFSLGDTVSLTTPSLSIEFSRKRFTEPIWTEESQNATRTRIAISIKDDHRLQEIVKSLDEWANSTVALLFFQNIRTLTIGDRTITREVIGEGPVQSSQRIHLTYGNIHEVIRIISPLEELPEEVQEEILQERMVERDDFRHTECSVEILVGIEGPQRLYVVLPTDKQICLPFSINAPFIQDPARMGIKDPAISPTNRWLLERVGRLAAEKMGEWLANDKLTIAERAEGYCLLPCPPQDSTSCEGLVCAAITDYVNTHHVLLASEGSITSDCFAPPYSFFDIWSDDEILTVSRNRYSAVISHDVRPEHRQQLVQWNLIQELNDSEVLDLFCHDPIPRPADTVRLGILWASVLELNPYRWKSTGQSVHIFPVEGSNRLYPAKSLVRIGDSAQDLSEDDMLFLSQYLLFLDRHFLRSIRERLKNPQDEGARIFSELLLRGGFENDTSSSKLITKAYESCTSKESPQTLIRFAHIIGRLNAAVPSDFRYLTRDGASYSPSHGLALDVTGHLERLLPQEYQSHHLLHDDYLAQLPPERRSQWIEWARSSKSNLCSILGIEYQGYHVYSRDWLMQWCISHGGREPESYPYANTKFGTNDYVFNQEVFEHLMHIEQAEETRNGQSVWTEILDLILSDPNLEWRKWVDASCYQRRGTSTTSRLNCGTLRATWVTLLSQKRCLVDTEGIAREPHELLLRNERTESLMEIEPFVRHDFDTPTLQYLLKALGVRDSPGSPESVLDRIQGLSEQKEKPPLQELIALYTRLDKLMRFSSLNEVALVRERFQSAKILYTQEGWWALPHEVFRSIPGGEMPGVYRIIPQLQDLGLWSRIGVMPEPTGDVLVEQMKALGSGQPIKKEDRSRIKAILSREPFRIWNELHHWLSLDSHWKPISEMTYYVSRNVGQFVDGLSPAVKSDSADVRMVDFSSVDGLVAHSGLIDLQSAIKPKVTDFKPGQGKVEVRPWMASLGGVLRRVQSEDPEEEEQIRAVADRLSATRWTPTNHLAVMPYLNGTPVGKEERPDIFWDDQSLYVRDLSAGRLLHLIPAELRRGVTIASVRDAITHCYEREADVIVDYCSDNFTLRPEGAIVHPRGKGDGNEEQKEEDDDTLFPHGRRGEDDLEDLVEDDDGPTGSDPDEDIENGPRENQRERHHQPRPPRLIEIFMESEGYHRGQDGRFEHPDGGYVQRCDPPFHWELYDRFDTLRGRFWVKDALLRKGVEIPYEVYRSIELEPRQSAIILRGDRELEPVEVLRGKDLFDRIREERIKVFHATYRIRSEDPIIVI